VESLRRILVIGQGGDSHADRVLSPLAGLPGIETGVIVVRMIRFAS